MKDDTMNRRGFLGGLGRWLTAGLLATTVGKLMLRPAEACERGYLCPGCPALKRCALPEAKPFQQARRGK